MSELKDTIEDRNERVVALIDMDCFFCQVMIRQQPELKGKPVVILQYSDTIDGGSSAIAVSYEARALGVKRGMRKKECLEVSKDITLLVMPHNRKKADLSIFRAASSEVMAIFAKHSNIFERASIDEAYIDITKNIEKQVGLPINKTKLMNTYIAGFEGSSSEQIDAWRSSLAMDTPNSIDYKLTLGAALVNDIRREVLRETGFTCSAGIGTNKIVAKLAAGTHKPNSLTIITPENTQLLYEKINLSKIRNFGGKFGQQLKADLGIELASELVRFSQAELISKYGDKTGVWLYGIARGHDDEEVKARNLVKATNCAKNFPQGIYKVSVVEQWVKDLVEELEERLAFEQMDNKRIPTQFHAHLRLGVAGSCSIQFPQVPGTDFNTLYRLAMRCLNKKLNTNGEVYSDKIFMLSLGVGKFIPAPSEKSDIMNMLKVSSNRASTSSTCLEDEMDHQKPPQPKPLPKPSYFDRYKQVEPVEHVETPVPPGATGTTNAAHTGKENSGWNTLSEQDKQIMMAPMGGGGATAAMTVGRTKCPVCNKTVEEAKLSEHLDFHTALSLQRQIESELRGEVHQRRKNTQGKRNSDSTKDKKPAKKPKLQSKDISTFFKKS